jgi:hypothetical protein
MVYKLWCELNFLTFYDILPRVLRNLVPRLFPLEEEEPGLCNCDTWSHTEYDYN